MENFTAKRGGTYSFRSHRINAFGGGSATAAEVQAKVKKPEVGTPIGYDKILERL